MSFQVFQAQGLRIYTGDTATISSYTGLAGEIAINTETKSVRILDGINAGGTPLTTADAEELTGLSLDQLADLALSSPNEGDTLVYKNGSWTNDRLVDATAAVDEMSKMIDVEMTNLQTGHVLAYNAASQKWVNQATATVDHNHDARYQMKGNYLTNTSNLGEVSDVQITMPDDGQSLVYDAGKWINTTLAGGSGSVDGITSVDGKIGIGTTSPEHHLHVKDPAGQICVEGTGSDYAEGVFVSKNKGGTARGGGLAMRSTDSAGNNPVEWYIGRPYAGNDKLIISRQTGDSTQGRSIAQTSKALMQIDANGKVGIGTNNPQGKLEVFHSTNDTARPTLKLLNGGGSAVFVSFYNGNGSTNYGRIAVGTGNSTQYITTSDYRLKENITEITDGITRIKQLNPSRFNFIADPENTVYGFIAHEVQDIVPEAISGEKDAVNEDGSINPQGIDQSKLVPLLTAALKEAIAKIEMLETRIALLEAK